MPPAFLDRLRPVVIIDAEGDKLVFRLGEMEVRQQPVMRVADDGKIIELGQAAVPDQPGRLIRLFDRSSDGNEAARRAFCRHHLMLASDGRISPRPRVLVLESALRKAFGPDAPDAIRTALQSDGFDAEFGAAT